MDSKYDKIRQVLSEQNNSIPPELEWSEMEKGIHEKMDVKRAALSSSGANNKRRWWMILVPFLVISVPLIWYFSSGSQTKLTEINKDTDHAESYINSKFDQPQENEIVAGNSITKETSNSNVSTSESASTDDGKDFYLNQGAVKNLGMVTVPEFNAKSKSGNTKNSLLLTTETLNGGSSFSAVSDEVIQSKNQTVSALEPDEDITTINKQLNNYGWQNNRNTLDFIFLERKNTQIVPTSSLFPDRLKVTMIDKDEHCFCRSHINAHRITILGGISTWNPAYGLSKPEREVYERSLVSFNSQVNYVRSYNNGLILMIGFQYNRLESVFDWQKELDNYTVTLKDTIVFIQNNLLTGQQIIKQSDIEVPVQATRIVKHYNSTSIYSIPFAVGKSWRCRKWQIDLLAGGSVSIKTNNIGKTVFNEEIIEYDASETEFLNNNFKWNAMVSSRLTYYPVSRFGITASLSYHKSLMNWSLEDGIHMYPEWMNVGLGISYDF